MTDAVSTVQFVEKVVKVPKEINDCYVALEKLVEDIAAKKPVAEIVAGSLQNMIGAVDGAQAIPTEAKEALKECVDGGLLMGNSLVFKFLGK